MIQNQMKFRKNLILGSAVAVAVSCLSQSVLAAALYWDTNGSATGSGAANGTWGIDQFFTTSSTGVTTPGTVATGTGDTLTFSAGSPQNGTGGTVAVSGTQNASTIALSQTGLTFSGGTIALAATTSNAITVNSSATINSALSFNFATAQSASITFNTNNQTLNLGGGVSNTNNAVNGPSVGGTTATNAASSTLQLNAGDYRIANYNVGDASTLTTGTFLNSTATASLGTTIAVGSGSNGLMTINGGTLSNNAAQNTAIVVGRSTGIGRMIVTTGSITVGGTGALLIGFQGSGTGTGQLDINGGTVTIAGDLAVSSTTTAAGATGTAALNITNGVTSVGKLDFGKGGTFAASTIGSGSLSMTGGKLYVGAGGIVQDGTGTYTSTRSLSGGIVGATAGWSSGLDMTLGTTNGNITLQAADASNTAKNISLSGILSGTGGLTKTGGGTLTLSGKDTYAGNTTVNAGTLALNSAGGLKFFIGASGVNNTLVDNSTTTLDGTFTFDLTGASATPGSFWTIVSNTANASYLSNFNVAGFSNNSGVWSNGTYAFTQSTGQLTLVPEPGSLALFGAGSMLFMRRRSRREM